MSPSKDRRLAGGGVGLGALRLRISCTMTNIGQVWELVVDSASVGASEVKV